MTEEDIRVPDLNDYELWIAHPNRHAFVASGDHWNYANRPGWWCTDWKGSSLDVVALGGKPQPRAEKLR